MEILPHQNGKALHIQIQLGQWTTTRVKRCRSKTRNHKWKRQLCDKVLAALMALKNPELKAVSLRKPCNIPAHEFARDNNKPRMARSPGGLTIVQAGHRQR